MYVYVNYYVLLMQHTEVQVNIQPSPQKTTASNKPKT